MLEQELVRYGYFILMAGVMVEGEAFLLAAAFLAHRGYLNIAAVIAIAAFGNALADQIYYQIARAKGREYFDRKAAEDPKVGRLHGWVQRRGAVLLFVSRFLFGFRIAIPAACGAVGMPARVFIPVNAAGSLMWAIVVGLGGYAFGNAADLFLSGMREYQGYVAAGIVVVGVVVFAFRSIDVRRTWGAVKRPPQAMVDLVGEMWSATHRAGRLALTRPTVRLAALVVAFGALNIATAVFAWRFALIERFTLWVPLEVAHGTRPVTLLVGLLLVALGRGLARRKRVAWALALGAVGFSVFLHLGHAASVLRAGVSVILLAELWRHQGEFTARSDPLRLRQALGAAVVLVVALTLFGIADIQRHVGGRIGLGAAFAETWRMAAFQDPVWMGLEPRGANVVWAIRLLAVAGASFILLLALAPVVLRSEPAEDLGPIRALAWEHGFDSLSYFAGQADKRHLVVEGGAFVGYRVESRVAVVAGDPVGRPESIRAAITRFVELCRENDWVPVFYETSARYLALYREAGLRWFKVGEEAVVPLASFSLQGPKVAKVRQAVNKIEREAPDLRVVEYPTRSGRPRDGRPVGRGVGRMVVNQEGGRTGLQPGRLLCRGSGRHPDLRRARRLRLCVGLRDMASLPRREGGRARRHASPEQRSCRRDGTADLEVDAGAEGRGARGGEPRDGPAGQRGRCERRLDLRPRRQARLRPLLVLLRLPEPVPLQAEVRAGVGGTLPGLSASGPAAADRVRAGRGAHARRAAVVPEAPVLSRDQGRRGLPGAPTHSSASISVRSNSGRALAKLWSDASITQSRFGSAARSMTRLASASGANSSCVE